MTATPDPDPQPFARNWTLAGRFVRDVTHDVNNQLGAALAYAELLALDVRDKPECKPSIDEILAAVQRASSILDTLASITGRDESTVQPIDLHAYVRDALRLFDREKDRRRLRLDVSIPEAPARILGVHTRIARLFAFIFSYAFDRLAESSESKGLRVHVESTGDATFIRIAGPPVFLTRENDEALVAARGHARHHRGEIVVNADELIVTIPRDTGLAID